MNLPAKTYDELFKSMNNALGNSIATMSQVCENIIDEFIEIYYDEYDPTSYRRTEQFLLSCLKTDVYKFSGKYYADIYIDYEDLHYKLNGLVIVEWANEGLHGGYDVIDDSEKHFFWDESWDKINRKILVQSFYQWFSKKTGCKVTVR